MTAVSKSCSEMGNKLFRNHLSNRCRSRYRCRHLVPLALLMILPNPLQNLLHPRSNHGALDALVGPDIHLRLMPTGAGVDIVIESTARDEGHFSFAVGAG